MESEVVWKSGMAFEATNREIKSQFDTTSGGSAPTPKEALLNAMSACSGIDVVMTLEKMRQKFDDLKITAQAKTTSSIPSYFSSVQMEYYLTGELASDKAIKAVVLSMTKYCGVSFMVSKVCPITYRIFLNDKLVHEDQARFTLEVV